MFVKYDYSPEKVEFLKNNVKGISTQELADRFNKEFNCDLSAKSIRIMMRKLNLKNGLDMRFKKGLVSWNKGNKMSKELYKKCKPTMFKKGNIPANARAIGSERTDSDGYIVIKIQDGHGNKNWIPKHRYIYESMYGNIPTGYKVVFADGNRKNLNPENLVCISNSEELIMNRNKLFKQDTDLTKAGVTVAKLLDKVNKSKKDL